MQRSNEQNERDELKNQAGGNTCSRSPLVYPYRIIFPMTLRIKALVHYVYFAIAVVSMLLRLKGRRLVFKYHIFRVSLRIKPVLHYVYFLII